MQNAGAFSTVDTSRRSERPERRPGPEQAHVVFLGTAYEHKVMLIMTRHGHKPRQFSFSTVVCRVHVPRINM